MKIYKKEKWFLWIGIFCILGFFVSLGINIGYAVGYLVVGGVLLFFSKNYLSFLMRKRKGALTEADNKLLAEVQRQKEQEQLRQQEVAAELAKYRNIAPGFGVNEAEKKVLINNNRYSFDAIVKCDLMENENTVTKTKGQKKVALGKAIAGGTLFGKAGAVIGGQAGKTKTTTTTEDYCTKLMIKVTIKDFQRPTEYITFINKRTSKNSGAYRTAFNNAQNCLSVLDIILDAE